MITPSFSLTATERVLPSMALDFTTASLDSRVTFTRSGNTATVTNSSGFVVPINANLPRFDYDPIALTCKGLLIEEAKTNLSTYSDNFSGANWSAVAVTVSTNQIISPDGTLNADKIIENTATAEHFMRQTITGLTVNTNHSTSVYVKTNGRDLSIRVLDADNTANGYRAFYNLTTGAITSNISFGVASILSATATNVGNDWWRVTLSGNGGLLCTKYIIDFFCLQGSNTNYLGNGTSGIYLWGAQLEAGPFATSYIPTVASQVTRTADVASMTGTNFSSWYNASEGAFVSSSVLTRQAAIGQTTIFSASDNTSANMINCFYRASGALGVNIFAATVSQLDQTQLGVTAANTIVNTGVAYKINNAASYANGTVQSTVSTFTVPTVTQLQFGISPTGSSLNGYVRSLRYYKQRILNAEGQAFSK
jgi:hypothetical protein